MTISAASLTDERTPEEVAAAPYTIRGYENDALVETRYAATPETARQKGFALAFGWRRKAVVEYQGRVIAWVEKGQWIAREYAAGSVR